MRNYITGWTSCTINYKILNGQKTWFINWRNYNRKPLKTSKQYKYLKNKFKEEPNKATRLKKCLFVKSYKEEGENFLKIIFKIKKLASNPKLLRKIDKKKNNIRFILRKSVVKKTNP